MSVASVRPPAFLEGMVWRNFGSVNHGGALMLVTVTGGAQAVLTAAAVPRKPAVIQTRDPKTGILRPIREDDDVARLLAAAPLLLAAAQGARDFLVADYRAAINDPANQIAHNVLRNLQEAIKAAEPKT